MLIYASQSFENRKQVVVRILLKKLFQHLWTFPREIADKIPNDVHGDIGMGIRRYG